MDGILPDGYRVTKGDGVSYMAYAMGRMPYIWGGDAEEFRLERWLKNGIFQPESRFKFIAFHVRIIFFSLLSLYIYIHTHIELDPL
jgi:cytochrome P450